MHVSKNDVQRFYDHFGRKQDTQAFYEDAALDDLIEHAQFENSQNVFEFGCGTGRLAQRLLQQVLPANAVYSACDISPVMIGLAEQRLSGYGTRINLMRADEHIHINVEDHSVERLVSTYVLDLLSETEIRTFLIEARRVLKLGQTGKLCLVSLANGVTLTSRAVIWFWRMIYRLRPLLLGGCRPLQLIAFLDKENWHVEYHHTVVRYGIPSEVVIAIPAVGRE